MTDAAVEAVARALCRLSVIQNMQQGDAPPDLQRSVDMVWPQWETEAKAAIAAYEAVTKASADSIGSDVPPPPLPTPVLKAGMSKPFWVKE